MKTGKAGFALILILAGAAPSARAQLDSIVLEVEAGDKDRRDTPIMASLPQGFSPSRPLTLERLSDRRAVPVQRIPGRPPSVAWILEEPLPKGTKRGYKLEVQATRRSEREPEPGQPVQVRHRAGDLIVELAGRPVLTYHAAVALPPAGMDLVFRRSGFIHPLTTRSGRVVTDDFPPDHAHQHGIFFAWPSGTFQDHKVDFWNQISRTGDVSHVEIRDILVGPVLAELIVSLRHQITPQLALPQPVLDETWRIRVYNVPNQVVFDLESEQKCAGKAPLALGKYLYGGLGLRGNRRWFDEKAEGNNPPAPARNGHSDFLTSEGKRRADGNHTRPRWVDLSGEVDGQFAGLAVLDHPANFRFPQPVRLHPNKPYFSVSPLVLDGFEIGPKEAYVSRYRLIAHDGQPDPPTLEAAWHDYAEPPRVKSTKSGPLP